jgi:hypothetical protein
MGAFGPQWIAMSNSPGVASVIVSAVQAAVAPILAV